MVHIRKATLADIPEIIACSLLCFPQEDPWDDHVYEDFIVLWPRLVYVAQDLGTGCIVGFVVAHMEGEDAEHHGYIANLGVHPTRRKLGIAAKLMTAAENAMVQEEYGCEYVYLNVRVSNHAAINLYTKTLGYSFHYTEAKFYNNDGGDAYLMRKQLPGKQPLGGATDGLPLAEATPKATKKRFLTTYFCCARMLCSDSKHKAGE